MEVIYKCQFCGMEFEKADDGAAHERECAKSRGTEDRIRWLEKRVDDLEAKCGELSAMVEKLSHEQSGLSREQPGRFIEPTRLPPFWIDPPYAPGKYGPPPITCHEN